MERNPEWTYDEEGQVKVMTKDGFVKWIHHNAIVGNPTLLRDYEYTIVPKPKFVTGDEDIEDQEDQNEDQDDSKNVDLAANNEDLETGEKGKKKPRKTTK